MKPVKKILVESEGQSDSHLPGDNRKTRVFVVILMSKIGT